MEHAVNMASCDIILLPRFVKIGAGVQANCEAIVGSTGGRAL
jgi:hypothetical protein